MSGQPRCVMEAAAATGFKHVPAHVIQQCLADIGVKGLRLAHQQVGALINAFRSEWQWSNVDIARAMRHVVPGVQEQPSKRKVPPEVDVYGETLRDEILDIIQAARALDAPAAAAAVAVGDVAPLGDGEVDAAFVEGLRMAEEARPSRRRSPGRGQMRVRSLLACVFVWSFPCASNAFLGLAWQRKNIIMDTRLLGGTKRPRDLQPDVVAPKPRKCKVHR